MRIRLATDADWPRIHPFYRAVIDAGRTYALPAGQSLDEARPHWMAEAPGCTFVAVDADGTVLGSAKAGPNRPARGAHVATGSFLVDPAHAGRGIGRALGEHVIAWARAEGYRAIQFNAVVETNRAAVHLWESLGFRVVGTVPQAFDDAEEGLVGLHVMHLPLG